MRLVVSMLVAISLGLAGCGGSSSGGSGGGGNGNPPPPPPPSPPPVSAEVAFDFLNQATFGATEPEVARVVGMGLEAWIDEQMALPASLHLPHVQAQPIPALFFTLHTDRVDVWFRHATNAPDQLRQRVAFALSEIFVVSQVGALNNFPYMSSDYYDLLVENAFGNYRELVEQVTLHPAMGIYLSMLGNEKPNPALNIRPDENFARELMQLFSIGLVELNADGSVIVDGIGQPVPTYDQAVIEGFAHVFTGWHFAGFINFENARPTALNRTEPMQLYPDFHDSGEKLLLGGVTLPARQDGNADLNDALDNVFNHPNVGPFIAIRLIQRLVTSNPSPGYVARVAAVFDDNGAGERGDLGAVVRAILLDDEARSGGGSAVAGKLKEPMLRLVQLWRAYDAQSGDGSMLPLNGLPPSIIFGQGPLQSPSVFNFFSPFYAPPGEIQAAGLVAPEFGIATEYQNTLVTNTMFYQAFVGNSFSTADPSFQPGTVYIDIGEEMALAGDNDALIDRVADKLLGGRISDTLRNEIAGMLALIPGDSNDLLRVAETIYLVASSPEFAYQR